MTETGTGEIRRETIVVVGETADGTEEAENIIGGSKEKNIVVVWIEWIMVCGIVHHQATILDHKSRASARKPGQIFV